MRAEYMVVYLLMNSNGFLHGIMDVYYYVRMQSKLQFYCMPAACNDFGRRITINRYGNKPMAKSK